MDEFWSGPAPLKGISARRVVLIGPYAGFAYILFALWLQPFRFIRMPNEFLFVIVIGALILFVLIFLPLLFVKPVERRELALGYTTTAVHPEVPRIDPKTRLIIRQVGEPEPTAEQWRQIKARIRELKAQQRAQANQQHVSDD